MKTYSFLVTIGSYEQIVEINALSEQEAIDIISREYPMMEGWRYTLI